MTQTQEEQQAMREAYAALDEIEVDERASRDSVLSVVKARVDSKLFAAIERCIEDCDDAGRAHSFSIVDQAYGDVQNSDYEFGEYHVHQYQNGGMSGDELCGRNLRRDRTVPVPRIPLRAMTTEKQGQHELKYYGQAGIQWGGASIVVGRSAPSRPNLGPRSCDQRAPSDQRCS